jgi:transposase
MLYEQIIKLKLVKFFDCKRSSLQRWIDKYEDNKNLSKAKTIRKSRKVKKEHITFIKSELKKKPDIFLQDLLELLKQEYPDLEITPQHLGRLTRDNNI